MAEWIKAIYRNNGEKIVIDNAPIASGRYLVTCYVKGTNGIGFYTDTAYYSREHNTWESSDRSRYLNGIVAYMDSPSAFICDEVVDDGDVFYVKKKPLYYNFCFNHDIKKLHELISLQHMKTGKLEMTISNYSYQDDELEDTIITANLIEDNGNFSIRLDKSICNIIVESKKLHKEFKIFDDMGILMSTEIHDEVVRYSNEQINFKDVRNFSFISHVKEIGYDDACERILTKNNADVVLTESYYDVDNKKYLINAIVSDYGDDLWIVLEKYVEDVGVWRFIGKYQTRLCLEDIYMRLATNLKKESFLYARSIHNC